MVHSDRVYYRFSSSSSSSSSTKWGYKFAVSPITGLQWLNEPQVRKLLVTHISTKCLPESCVMICFGPIRYPGAIGD